MWRRRGATLLAPSGQGALRFGRAQFFARALPGSPSLPRATLPRLCARGHGGYGGQPKDVVLCACSNKQLYEIEHAVQAIDPGCFIIMLQSNEVHGEGFRQLELGTSESSESK